MLRVGTFFFRSKHLSHFLKTKIRNSIQRSLYSKSSLELRVLWVRLWDVLYTSITILPHLCNCFNLSLFSFYCFLFCCPYLLLLLLEVDKNALFCSYCLCFVNYLLIMTFVSSTLDTSCEFYFPRMQFQWKSCHFYLFLSCRKTLTFACLHLSNWRKSKLHTWK